MIDLKWLESDKIDEKWGQLPRDIYKQNLINRGADPALVDEIIKTNELRKKKIFEADTQKAELNAISKKVAELKKNKQDASEIIQKTQELSKNVKALTQEADELDGKIKLQLSVIPNQCAKDVPIGKSEDDNVVVKEWGTKRNFDFKPLEHFVLAEQSDTIDFDKAGQVTGARFAFLKGAAARMERALIQLMLDTHTEEHGYQEFIPPFIVNQDSLYGTGNLPKFKEDLFKLEGNEYFLIPTAEVPLTNYHREEILEEASLPRLLTAYTPCFRSEAGSYGRDTKGLIRQHQFNKVEIVKICHPSESEAQHEKLLSEAESILQKLNLPYQVVCLCTGDISFGAQKCYDINVWLPGQNAYREISSCSNFGSFQARRANIRFKSKDPKSKPQFCHTLNGSGLAVGRTLVAIYENYQNPDGSITVPEALKPYMNGLEVIK